MGQSMLIREHLQIQNLRRDPIWQTRLVTTVADSDNKFGIFVVDKRSLQNATNGNDTMWISK